MWVRMKKIMLNSGYEIDSLGSGTNTFGKVGGEYSGAINMDTTALKSAIELGYRMFDTALSYRNESVVGKAIRESRLPRELFYITSKIPGREPYIYNVADAVNSSLENLGVECIDLYLIHHPWDNMQEVLRVWKTLESYVSKGFIKSLGVSNFSQEQLEFLYHNVNVKPAVNQIESHPGHWNDDLIEFTQSLGVAVQAWGPLSRVSEVSVAALNEIGAKYHKTWAQVILRYQVERNVIVIPKSHSAQNQSLNIDIFDFELSDRDRLVIKGL